MRTERRTPPDACPRAKALRAPGACLFIQSIVLLTAGWLQLSGCTLCPMGAAVVESRMPDCEGVAYDNLRSRLYRVKLSGDTGSGSRTLTLSISKNCEVSYPEDLSRLGIESMAVENPRSSTRAVLVIRTGLKDASGDPITCSAPLAAFDRMQFICPGGAGKLAFMMEPLK